MASPRQRRASAGKGALTLGVIVFSVLHGLRGWPHFLESEASTAAAGPAFAVFAKRPKNAYMFFAADNRADYAEEGKPVTEVSKQLGKAWRELSAAKRKKYEKMAVADRQRFEKDLESGLELKPRSSKKAKAEKKEKKEKKAGPKRPRSAYIWFSTAMRPKYAQKGMSVGEVAKILGSEWQKLKATGRKKYEKQAAEDKVRYQQELEAVA